MSGQSVVLDRRVQEANAKAKRERENRLRTFDDLQACRRERVRIRRALEDLVDTLADSRLPIPVALAHELAARGQRSLHAGEVKDA